jgi:hypothetical protein
VDLGGECGADLIEVQLHHGGVGAGQNQADGAAAAFRTAGAEDIGVLRARIDRHRRPRAGGGPAVSATAFLPHPGFILAPQLNGLARMSGGDCLKLGREFF